MISTEPSDMKNQATHYGILLVRAVLLLGVIAVFLMPFSVFENEHHGGELTGLDFIIGKTIQRDGGLPISILPDFFLIVTVMLLMVALLSLTISVTASRVFAIGSLIGYALAMSDIAYNLTGIYNGLQFHLRFWSFVPPALLLVAILLPLPRGRPSIDTPSGETPTININIFTSDIRGPNPNGNHSKNNLPNS